jgi:hypothetical protein
VGPKFIFRPHFYVSGGYGLIMAPNCGNGTLNYDISAICDFPKCGFSAPLGRTVYLISWKDIYRPKETRTIGTVADRAPTPRPLMRRPMANCCQTLVAVVWIITPIMNTRHSSDIAFFRPRQSFIGAPKMAPTKVPIDSRLTMRPELVVLNSQVVTLPGIAQVANRRRKSSISRMSEICPVSYPIIKPPIEVVKANIMVMNATGALRLLGGRRVCQHNNKYVATSKDAHME